MKVIPPCPPVDRLPSWPKFLPWLVALGLALNALAQGNCAPAAPVSLQTCIEAALAQNRDLQIERINPAIARLALSAAYGYYDPVFFSQTHRESATDSGGFDPADFSADAVYSADSEVSKLGLTGFLPSGLSYSLDGSYAHSDGSRNFLNFDSYKLSAAVTVRQPLLKNFWIDQGRLTIRLNRKNLQITQLGVRYMAMDVINRTQLAYAELLFAWEDLKVGQRLRQAREELLKGIQRQVEVGTLTVTEETLAQSDLARVQTLLIAASNAVVLAGNELKTLLGYPTTNWTDQPLLPAERLLAVPEPLDLAASWERGLTGRPDLLQLARELEKTDIDLKYRRNQLFPSLDLVAGYGRRGASASQIYPPFRASASLSDAFEQIDNATAPSDMVGVILSFPLSQKAERANYRASKQLKAQAGLRLKQKEELVLREVSDALNTARSSLDRVTAARQARHYAQAALAVEEQKLAGGKSTLFFVLQLQSDLAVAETAEIRAKADYQKALSQLAFAEGSLLDRHRIAVEVK